MNSAKFLTSNTLFSKLLSWERPLRYLILCGTLIMIIFMTYLFRTGTDALYFSSSDQRSIEARGEILKFYITYRNSIYLFWLFIILPAIVFAFISRKGSVRPVRLLLTWLGVLLFVFLSYVLAGLISDLIVVATILDNMY